MEQTQTQLQKPILRGHFHQAAFFMALGACAMLVSKSRNTIELIATLVYSFSLTGLLGISTLYHRPNWKPERRKWMRRLDHSAIYILIAGTSTPICLLLLPHATGIKMLELVWGAALFGILQSLFWVEAPKWVSSTLYIIVGCLVIPFLSELRMVLSSKDLVYLFVGGFAYIVGAIIYALKKPNPFPKYFGHHEIFHLLVIAGAFFHFLVINSLIP